MRQKSLHPELPSERIVKNIRRATRKRHSSEEKIRITSCASIVVHSLRERIVQLALDEPELSPRDERRQRVDGHGIGRIVVEPLQIVGGAFRKIVDLSSFCSFITPLGRRF